MPEFLKMLSKTRSSLLNKSSILQKYHRFQKQLLWARENGLQIKQQILDFGIYGTSKWESILINLIIALRSFKIETKPHFLQLFQCQTKYLHVWADVSYCKDLSVLATLHWKLPKIGGIICCPNGNIHKNPGWREKCWFQLFPHAEPDFWIQINWNKRISSIYRQIQAHFWWLLFFLFILILLLANIRESVA